MNIFYSPDYVGAAYSFETTRKAKWVADSLSRAPIAGIKLVEPAPLSREQLAQVHSMKYIQAVETGSPRSLAESQGFVWDPGLWPMVLSSNGGAVAAALDALQHGVAGSLSSGLHHARRGAGAGFCTFNGLVIAAGAALDAGADGVLILDLDAHCGGGTASLIANEPRISQADVSVDAFDYYRASSTPSETREADGSQGTGATGHAQAAETGPRIWLRLVDRGCDYLAAVAAALDEMTAGGRPFELCLFNAGMDPFERCSTGGLPGITAEILKARERMVFDWLRTRGVPVAFVLAGGYVSWGLDQAGLVALHRLTLLAAVA